MSKRVTIVNKSSYIIKCFYCYDQYPMKRIGIHDEKCVVVPEKTATILNYDGFVKARVYFKNDRMMAFHPLSKNKLKDWNNKTDVEYVVKDKHFYGKHSYYIENEGLIEDVEISNDYCKVNHNLPIWKKIQKNSNNCKIKIKKECSIQSQLTTDDMVKKFNEEIEKYKHLFQHDNKKCIDIYESISKFVQNNISV